MELIIFLTELLKRDKRPVLQEHKKEAGRLETYRYRLFKVATPVDEIREIEVFISGTINAIISSTRLQVTVVDTNERN